jgi:beta-glucosidase
VGDELAIRHATELAAAADLAIVVVGTNEEVESEGYDRRSLKLPGRQDELVRRVAAANPHTVVVVNSGAPVLLPWREDVAAILLTWFPGQEFGNALADVLLGVVEPGGRLPTTWPAYEGTPLPSTSPVNGEVTYVEGVHIGYRAFLRAVVEPAYWFGHGLGYTSWSHGDPEVSADGPGGAVVVIPVRNIGTREGRAVLQVYASRPESAVDRPDRWLVGFATVEAAPGEQVTASVPIRPRAFEHWDVSAQRWALEPGSFELYVARSAGDVMARISFEPARQAEY